MSSEIGNIIKTTVFGESHGVAIGAVMDAPPAGYKISTDELLVQMSRRAPGNDTTATARKEADVPEFLSGLLEGTTTGAPLALIIRNSDTRSKNYDNIADRPRPSHADYAASVRFGGFNDIRGGGNFSARLTAPLVAAGSVARQILKANGITVGGHVSKIGSVKDASFDAVNITADQLEKLNTQYFATLSEDKNEEMRKVIAEAKQNGDSVGGEVEIAVTGLPVGIGSPSSRGIENIISSAIYCVPAVKGVEFGRGFVFSELSGSQANDSMYFEGDTVKCRTNNCGGITGGISNGMPLVIRAVLKPTPSIAKEQDTVNLKTKQNDKLIIEGRHDPCIVPRALPAIEAAICLAILDLLAEVHKL
ncbi:MAG: chorismate synthase [Clostridia bacterium]|nr:chorismate synthase [Clostridia bacterium]